MSCATSMAPQWDRCCGRSLAISTWLDMALGSGSGAAPATPCPPCLGSAESCQWHLKTPGWGPWQGPQPHVGPGLSERGGDVGNPAPAGRDLRTRLTGSSALPAPGQARAGGTPSHRPAAPAGWGRAAALLSGAVRTPFPGNPHREWGGSPSSLAAPWGEGLPPPWPAPSPAGCSQEPTATPLCVCGGCGGLGAPATPPVR